MPGFNDTLSRLVAQQEENLRMYRQYSDMWRVVSTIYDDPFEVQYIIERDTFVAHKKVEGPSRATNVKIEEMHLSEGCALIEGRIVRNG